MRRRSPSWAAMRALDRARLRASPALEARSRISRTMKPMMAARMPMAVTTKDRRKAFSWILAYSSTRSAIWKRVSSNSSADWSAFRSALSSPVSRREKAALALAESLANSGSICSSVLTEGFSPVVTVGLVEVLPGVAAAPQAEARGGLAPGLAQAGEGQPVVGEGDLRAEEGPVEKDDGQEDQQTQGDLDPGPGFETEPEGARERLPRDLWRFFHGASISSSAEAFAPLRTWAGSLPHRGRPARPPRPRSGR